MLVTRSGDCKLADFGSAHKLLKESDNKQKMFGSVFWMAPEVIAHLTQVIKQSGYGFYADIWSLGATVLEMLTKYPPFFDDNANIYTVMHKIAGTDELPYLDSKKFSEEAIDFVYTCLQES